MNFPSDRPTDRQIGAVLADLAAKKQAEAMAALPGGTEPAPKPHEQRRAEAIAASVVRANYLPAPAVFHLDHACAMIHDAFGDCPYLVGSSLVRRDYRDVDVRLILDDAHFDHLFPDAYRAPRYHPLWSLLCSSLSDWLAKTSGLPVDFQIQRRTEANAQYTGQRQALGMFHSVGLPTRYTTGHP
jgi:hypothetical protein